MSEWSAEPTSSVIKAEKKCCLIKLISGLKKCWSELKIKCGSTKVGCGKADPQCPVPLLWHPLSRRPGVRWHRQMSNVRLASVVRVVNRKTEVKLKLVVTVLVSGLATFSDKLTNNEQVLIVVL